MINIFPTITTIDTETIVNDIQSGNSQEYAWDFINNDFILKNGRPVIVTGTEAIKIWIYKTLKTPRYRFFAYSNDYGQEYENLIGQGYLPQLIKSEAERLTKEALFIHSDILDISNFNARIDEDILYVEFNVSTIYGNIQISTQ